MLFRGLIGASVKSLPPIEIVNTYKGASVNGAISSSTVSGQPGDLIVFSCGVSIGSGYPSVLTGPSGFTQIANLGVFGSSFSHKSYLGVKIMGSTSQSTSWSYGSINTAGTTSHVAWVFRNISSYDYLQTTSSTTGVIPPAHNISGIGKTNNAIGLGIAVGGWNRGGEFYNNSASLESFKSVTANDANDIVMAGGHTTIGDVSTNKTISWTVPENPSGSSSRAYYLRLNGVI